MPPYPKKHRNGSLRLQTWDYRWAGAYFITLCTHNRKHYFGEVTDGKMQLSHIGVIADILWHEIKNHTHNTDLDAFVVMPNHIHGIIIINDTVSSLHAPDDNEQTSTDNTVSSLYATSRQQSDQHATSRLSKKMSELSPKAGSLSAIIRSYKSAVTRHARRLGYSFAWQPNYYENIIRDSGAFTRIQQYIINNPKKWNEDKFS